MYLKFYTLCSYLNFWWKLLGCQLQNVWEGTWFLTIILGDRGANVLMPRVLPQERKLWPTGRIWPVSGFVYKVLLEHSDAHVFAHCRWLLLCCNGREKLLWLRPYGPPSLKSSLSGPLPKTWPMPGVLHLGCNCWTHLTIDFMLWDTHCEVLRQMVSLYFRNGALNDLANRLYYFPDM